MIKGARVLGLITARGGSKGIRRKNLVTLGGKSLIAWAADAARSSRYIDRVVISSDDSEIIAAAQAADCDAPFIRPAHLALDETPHADVVTHALAEVGEGFEYFVLLQPTSPLRTAADIDGCIEACVRHDAPVAVSVMEFDKNPSCLVSIDGESRVRPLLGDAAREVRRQDRRTFLLNGAVYVCRCDWWGDNKKFLADATVSYIMPAERSIDIDSEIDVRFAEVILGSKQQTKVP